MAENGRILNVSWTQWKVFVTRFSISTYYIVVAGSPFYAIAVDIRFIYLTTLTAAADVTEFTTTYQSAAVPVLAIDDAIAIANKLEAQNAVPYDGNGNVLAVQAGTAIAVNQGGLLTAGTDGTNARIVKVDSAGDLIVVNKNAAFGATTTASISAGSSGNISVTTGYIHQILLMLEVRPSVADNTFAIDIYKDSGRTKRIFTLSNITSNEFVTDEHLAMYLVDSIMYITITNNNISGARTYTIEGVVEVRS